MFSLMLSDLETFDLAVESRNRDLVEYLKPAALSLACHQGNLDRVKSMISEYDCDLKGLAHVIVVFPLLLLHVHWHCPLLEWFDVVCLISVCVCAMYMTVVVTAETDHCFH